MINTRVELKRAKYPNKNRAKAVSLKLDPTKTRRLTPLYRLATLALYVIALSICVLFCAPKAAFGKSVSVNLCQTPTQPIVTSHGVGKIHVGMALNEALAICKHADQKKDFDDEGDEIDVLIPEPQLSIKVELYENRIWRIIVRDKRFSTAAGIRTGTILPVGALKDYEAINGEGWVY